MSERQRKTRTLRWLVKAAWQDGWVAAWLFLTAVNLLAGAFVVMSDWMAGAFFGGTIGLAAGYFVTQNRNYRRVKREDLVWQLERVKDMELRAIARGNSILGNEGALEHIRDGRAQLERELERVS